MHPPKPEAAAPRNPNEERAVRLEKLHVAREMGIDPYPARVSRTHEIGRVLGLFEQLESEKAEVTITGRVQAVRGHGGACFADLEDGSGRIQLHLKSDVLGATSFETFEKLVDRGDFLQISGVPFVTKRGEKSIEAKTWTLLTKTLAPLPDKWAGLADVETRYRKRYLDLVANEEVRALFRKRSAIVREIRDFMHDEGFMEVETPMLQPIAGGASARPFITHHNALDIDLYLRIATELHLKRLVVGGFDRVFEIGRCFRNEGIDHSHNPEFTSIETYQAYADYSQVMDMTERMLSRVAQKVNGKTTVVFDGMTIDFAGQYPRISFRDALMQYGQLDIDQLPRREDLAKAAEMAGIEVRSEDGRGVILDNLYKKLVRPRIVDPTFLIDHPAEILPLAKRKPGAGNYVESFQLVLGRGIELAKAFTELNDPLDQKARFEEQEKLRSGGDDEAQPMDTDFIEALETGMPPTGGFGMGIERLCMVLLGQHSIKEIILFPTHRPEARHAAAPAPATAPAALPPRRTDVSAFDQIKEKLAGIGASFEARHHAADVMSQVAFGLGDGTTGLHAGAKAIVLKGKKTGNFHLFVLPEDCKIDQKKVKAIIGEHVSFASADEVVAATGCVPGSVPPFGSVIGLRTRMDQRLAENAEIFFNAGSLTDSIRMPFADYARAEQPESVDCAA